jgi:hypothetical protein
VLDAPHAVDDDRVETDAVEEGEREGQVIELVGQDGAADFEDGKLVGSREDPASARVAAWVESDRAHLR